jgi:hypothetical protein
MTQIVPQFRSDVKHKHVYNYMISKGILADGRVDYEKPAENAVNCWFD